MPRLLQNPTHECDNVIVSILNINQEAIELVIQNQK